jgi:hypothetical protein
LTSVATGFGAPGTFVKGASLAQRFAQGYTVVGAGVGSYKSTRHIIEGCATPWDALGYAPAVGFLGKRGLRDLGALRLKNFKNNSTRYYHGTTTQSAENIRNNGINLEAGRENLDFGKGFYTTQSRQHAIERAGQMVDKFGGAPDVLNYRLPNSKLSKLKELEFFEPSTQWKNFTMGNRNNTLPMHDYDLVSGPVLRNLTKGNAWPYPAYNQTSVHTQKAVDLFNNGLR